MYLRVFIKLRKHAIRYTTSPERATRIISQFVRLVYSDHSPYGSHMQVSSAIIKPFDVARRSQEHNIVCSRFQCRTDDRSRCEMYFLRHDMSDNSSYFTRSGSLEYIFACSGANFLCGIVLRLHARFPKARIHLERAQQVLHFPIEGSIYPSGELILHAVLTALNNCAALIGVDQTYVRVTGQLYSGTHRPC
jgi:hypothetical protein